MTQPEAFIGLRLWDHALVVLFDWLQTTDESLFPFSHPAQKQALRDLLSALESTGIGFTEDQLTLAQERVARYMSDDDRRI